ncbi:tetratricopeptide repeat protein [Umezawaea sp. Da 62-37]|uniref:tetratricopeptide repeat protein n=1 Tax=Umezawaea sp. Da 62-37 TaxID=3075927 RepID=UPI0028F6FE71|nr:tetratricopeptide repeat protein [Umezawaea sp. Da 62-37]WNV86027.1 tetratricopeptide repeat protein [Umezawaea sp. Da 62-37]
MAGTLSTPADHERTGGTVEHDARCAEERLEAEGEVAVARLLLADGDPAHAARHLSDALARDPGLAETYEALSELAAHVGGPHRALELFDLETPYSGTVAGHAHLSAAAGEWDEAVRLLVLVAAQEPDRAWLDVTWLRGPDLAASVSPEIMVASALHMASCLPDPVDDDVREALSPLLALLRESVALNPDDARLLWSGSTFARRLGAVEEAIAWARRSFEVEPSHEAAIMIGYALRAAERYDEALRVWQDEAERTPEDLGLHIDISDLLVRRGDPERALVWAERALEADPTHPKAGPTADAVRYRIDGDVRHLLALAESELPYAAEALTDVSWDRPVLGRAADQTEATTNSLGQALEQVEPSPDLEVGITVTALEPPSSVLALHLAFPSATVVFESVPDPDPRVAKYEVEHAVWTYDDAIARPAVPPPSPEAAEAVRRIASFRWESLPALYDSTVVLSAVDPADLLGTLVHPPATPDTEFGATMARHAPNLWLSGVQVTACLGIAHHAVDEPWETSRRREILLDLLHGAEDWVNVAAGIALVATAWVVPETRQDVKYHVVTRMVDAVRASHQRQVSILGPLCELVLVTPGTEDDYTSLAKDALSTLDE